MRIKAARSIVLAGFLALSLAGCKTDGTFDFLSFNEQSAPITNVSLEQPPAPEAISFEEQELAPPPVSEPQPVYNNPANNTPRGEALLGNNPADELEAGKKHYREQNFGLAERYFRRAVEAAPQNAEAWMGLAASYDKLRRFDLADRAYAQAFSIFAAARRSCSTITAIRIFYAAITRTRASSSPKPSRKTRATNISRTISIFWKIYPQRAVTRDPEKWVPVFG